VWKVHIYSKALNEYLYGGTRKIIKNSGKTGVFWAEDRTPVLLVYMTITITLIANAIIGTRDK